MKKLLALVLAVSMATMFVACGEKTENAGKESGTTDIKTEQQGASEGEAKSSDVQKIMIGNALSNLDESNQRSVNGINAYVEEFNSTHDDIQIEVITTDAQNSVDKQFSDVESLISQGCQGIILNAVDTTGAIPIIDAIDEAGVICMECRGVQSDKIDIVPGAGWEQTMCDLSKEWLRAYLEQNPEVVLNFGIILGAPAQTDQLIRGNFVKELAEEMPDRVTVQDERYGNWSTTEAQTIMEDWIQTYPEMNAICAASDDTALGAINTLASLNKLEDFVITSYDGTANGLAMIQDGKLDMTIRMKTEEMGASWVEHMLKAINGEFTEKSYAYSTDCFQAVDSTNIDEMLK